MLGLDPLILSTAVALGLGLAVGIERERSKAAGTEREVAGVRTFTLVAVLGLLAQLLQSPWALAVFGAGVAAIALAGHVTTGRDESGITTEVALLATFALGALSYPHPAYAAGLAVVITILLASRGWLHDMVRTRLSAGELQDALLLLASVLVVLPLLPDRTVDPLQVINPRRLWYVVVLVMGLNALAYIALRLLGPLKGLAVAGVLGGFISSISTHAAMGQRATAQPAVERNAAAAANFSSVATAVLLIIVISAVHVELALQLLLPLAAAGIVSTLIAAALTFRAGEVHPAEVPIGRPLSLRAALTFGFILALVLIASAALAQTLGARGALASITAAGFADTHSAAITAALMRQREVLSADTAQLAVLAAFTTNAIVKIIVSWTSGPRAYAMHASYGVVLSVSTAWLIWLVM
jgi:uncharacterized membrane protein (DUF4010 family)